VALATVSATYLWLFEVTHQVPFDERQPPDQAPDRRHRR
jgi:hypothetical protein